MGVLPIGFFAPLPLPMMIPFMGIQSAVMAEQFGTMFQYGKRRISAMSNEEFNKMTPEMLQARITTQIQGMIPEMEKQIQAMRPMVVIIMKEFAEYVRLATEAIAKGGEEYLTHAAHGHIFGHGDTYVPPPTTTEPTPQPEPSPEPTPTEPAPGISPPITTPEPTEAQKLEIEIETAWANLWQAQYKVNQNTKYGGDSTSWNQIISGAIRQIYDLQEKYKLLTGQYYLAKGEQEPTWVKNV